MNIFIPTDFSKAAENAVNYALKLYGTGRHKFILYHAFVPFESAFYDEDQSARENELAENQFRSKLQSRAKKILAQFPNCKVETMVDRAAVSDGILASLKAKKTDLVIMGTTGAKGLKAKLVGSNAAEVLSRSFVPVISIPENYKPSLPLKIAFCSNYLIEDLDALDYLGKMADDFKSELHIWHFYSKVTAGAYERNLSEDYLDMIGRFLKKRDVHFHFTRTLDVAEALNKLSENKEFGLMALITKKRNGFLNKMLDKSMTKKVVYHSQIPVLAIPVMKR